MDQVNWTSIQGNWNKYKGQIKEKWGKLTDDDLMRIGGNRDQLIGVLQQRYGMAKDRLEEQVDEFAGGDIYDDVDPNASFTDRVKHKATAFVGKTKDFFQGQRFKDKVHAAEDYVRHNHLVAMGV